MLGHCRSLLLVVASESFLWERDLPLTAVLRGGHSLLLALGVFWINILMDRRMLASC